MSDDQEWFTHESFDGDTTEIAFATPTGNVRCAVTDGVFSPPAGVRLHTSFRRAAPPAEARELLRQQKIEALRAEAQKLGLDLSALAGPTEAGASEPPSPTQEPAAAPPRQVPVIGQQQRPPVRQGPPAGPRR